MRRLAFFLVAAACACPAAAQDAGDTPTEISCDQKVLSEEVRTLCDGLQRGYVDAMSRAVDYDGAGRAVPKPSLIRRPVSTEITERGLTAGRDRTNPLAAAEDRGVGLRIRGTDSPLQVQTEMVQPGAAGDTALNWELRAERAPETSGLFVGGATAGTFNVDGSTESVSGFAGVRSVAKPNDTTRLGAEIAPRVGVSDAAGAQTNVAVEPKVSAKTDFGRLGTSDFTGSLDANAGYSMPVDGNTPSAWGGFRFIVKPK